MNFGGVEETVVTREEFPLEKAREVLKNETIAVIGYGGQGAWHCKQILKSEVAELAGTYDIRQVRMDAAVTDGVHTYEST